MAVMVKKNTDPTERSFFVCMMQNYIILPIDSPTVAGSCMRTALPLTLMSALVSIRISVRM